MYEHILVALDGSALSEHSLPHVQALAEKFGSGVTLLRAVTSPEAFALSTSTTPVMGQPFNSYTPSGLDPNELADAEAEGATSYLTQIADRLRALNIKVDTVEPEDDPADAILAYAQEHNIDLIAMTTHGRKGFRRMILGSVADDVLRRATCPLLLIRVHDDKPEK
jgi:nucleotide-binding universal stress UspA family protein